MATNTLVTSKLPSSPGVSAAPLAHVSQGDLITADLLNALIDRVNALASDLQSLRSLDGDVDGPAANNTVRAIQGRPVADATPTNGQVLMYAKGKWLPYDIIRDIAKLAAEAPPHKTDGRFDKA